MPYGHYANIFGARKLFGLSFIILLFPVYYISEANSYIHLMIGGLFIGIGNGVILKLVPYYFNKQAGVVNGIVSMMGGLGGFFPPLLLSSILAVTGQYAIGFMMVSSVSLASLVLVVMMYYQDKLSLSQEVVKTTGQGLLVTDTTGVIRLVNPTFTRLTGYSEEAIGRHQEF